MQLEPELSSGCTWQCGSKGVADATFPKDRADWASTVEVHADQGAPKRAISGPGAEEGRACWPEVGGAQGSPGRMLLGRP